MERQWVWLLRSNVRQMTKDTYHAPDVMPNPPFVTLTATSKADRSTKASVTVHILDDHSRQ